MVVSLLKFLSHGSLASACETSLDLEGKVSHHQLGFPIRSDCSSQGIHARKVGKNGKLEEWRIW